MEMFRVERGMDGWMDGGGTYAAPLEAMFIDTATFSKSTCLLFVRWDGWMSFVVVFVLL